MIQVFDSFFAKYNKSLTRKDESMPTKTKGSWKITNLKGVERVFKDAEHPDAIAWMSNRDDKVPPKPKVDKPKKPKTA